MTRRESLLAVAAPLAATIVSGAPAPDRKLNVVCVGGHPDDPESGCGGTLARYSARGHNVTIVYLTRGEAGIPGRTHDEAAHIRTDEALKACRILSAAAIFAGQIDGSSEITNARYRSVRKTPEWTPAGYRLCPLASRYASRPLRGLFADVPGLVQKRQEVSARLF